MRTWEQETTTSKVAPALWFAQHEPVIARSKPPNSTISVSSWACADLIQPSLPDNVPDGIRPILFDGIELLDLDDAKAGLLLKRHDLEQRLPAGT
jgi:hypothetical protein